MLSIAVHNQQSRLRVDKRLFKQAVRLILEDAGIETGEISVAVVDDPTIARVHGEFLGDDSPTDVISFVFDSSPGRLEGEVVASADTAMARCPISIGRRKKSCCFTSSTAPCIWSATMIQPPKRGGRCEKWSGNIFLC